MGAIEPWHLILLLVIAVIVVGPGRLPDVGRATGEALREFRKATRELTGTVGPSTPPPAAPAAPSTEASNATPSDVGTHLP